MSDLQSSGVVQSSSESENVSVRVTENEWRHVGQEQVSDEHMCVVSLVRVRGVLCV